MLAPCALGSILTDDVVPGINARIIAGAANNQLANHDVAEVLFRRGVTCVPDYYASAGGVISGCGEYFGWSLDDTIDQVRSIGSRITELLTNAQLHDQSPEAYARSL